MLHNFFVILISFSVITKINKMSLPSLVPKVLYGHRLDVQNNAHYITDTNILYAGGAFLIFQDVTTNSQKYLVPPENACLKRLCLSPGRNLIATLVVVDEEYHIYIYDTLTLKKKRTLSLPADANTRKIESFCFSYDEVYVMIISGEPDWMMLVFNWERGKVESSTRANLLTNPTAPVKEVVCSPVDTSTLVIYGQGIFRLMNMQETVWRQYGFQKGEPFDITSCCFLGGDRILCGTNDGLLFLIELGELKFMFEANVVTFINAKAAKEEEFVGIVLSSTVLERAKVLEEDVKQERAVRALTPLSNGFAFACGTEVHFFEKIAPHKYQKRNIYEIIDQDFQENRIINLQVVTHLAVNPSETRMMATTRICQLYEVNLWGPKMDISGKVPFRHLGYSLHTGKVGDLAVCLWKPIFMSFGVTDRSVRVWNYLTKKLEILKQYQENLHSISLHPTGLYAAIGFSDKLRIVIVLINDLQVFRELSIRECPKSAFNFSGHLLAAVNRNIIQIYNTLTYQLMANLKGHNGPITNLRWTLDNRKLISCGTDGAIYEWDINSFKRIGEIVHKEVSYWDCAALSDGKTIFAIGSDNCLKEICLSNVIRTVNFKLKNLRRITISRSDLIMFITSSNGWLMALKMPVEEPVEYEAFRLYSANIEQIVFSVDDKIFIACSEMGTICVWTLENTEGKVLPLDKDFSYIDEILISRSDLEEKLSNIKDLTQRTHEMEVEYTYKISHMNGVYKEKIKDIEATYNQAVEELKKILEILEANHNAELNDISRDLNTMTEQYEAEMLETEGKYSAELTVEYEKVQELKKLRKTVSEDYKSKLAMLQSTKEKAIEDLTRINEAKLYNLNKMVEEANEELKKETSEHLDLTQQIEDDNDREIENLKSSYEKSLKAARESNLRLKGESGILKKKILSCEKERDNIQMEIINVTADVEKFKRGIQALDQKVVEVKKEIGERDFRIQSKEKRLYDLKRKEQEYERYKFVLNYRIKELKNQIEPMNNEIKEKKKIILDREDELYELQKINLFLDNKLNLMREKLGNLYKSLHFYKSKCSSIMSLIKNLKTDIYMASADVQDSKKLQDSVKKLYFKYITDKKFAEALKGNEECITELRRQNMYLHEIMSSLNSEVELSKKVRYGEGKIYIEMNWVLIYEINKIRKKLKRIQLKIQKVESLISGKLVKLYTPGDIQKLIDQALVDKEEIIEERKIKMEEAMTKTTMMEEEVNALEERLNRLEIFFFQKRSSKAKKKVRETLKFDIPSIV